MSARGERGTVTLFTILSLAFLLAMGGIAIDLAYLTAVRSELQRSMDAAALAGTGNLGFGDYAFSAARDAARVYAGWPANGYRGGTNGIISLNLNAGNDAAPPITPPGGYITLGTFSGGTFTPSSNGSVVNAVKCRYESTIPASFLRILGFDKLTVSAEAIAVASPPLTPPPGPAPSTWKCVFPVAVSRCAFKDGESYNSNGCGAFVRFSSVAALDSKSATWINLGGETAPTVDSLRSTIIDADVQGGCPRIPSGNTVGTMNFAVLKLLPGFDDVIDQTLGTKTSPGIFRRQFDASETITVKNNTGAPTYTGKGWVVYVPVIETDCPVPGTGISGSQKIVSWTRLVITQVVHRGVCLVEPSCSVGNASEIRGYYDCNYFDAPYNPEPAPIAALSRRLHLVR